MRKRALRPDFRNITKLELIEWMREYFEFMNTDVKFATNYVIAAIRECDNGFDWVEEYDIVRGTSFTIKQVTEKAQKRFKYTYEVNNEKEEDIKLLSYSRIKLLMFKMVSVGILDVFTKKLDPYGQFKNCKNKKSSQYVFTLRNPTNRFHLNPVYIYRRLWDKNYEAPINPTSEITKVVRLVPPSDHSINDWTECTRIEPEQTSLFQGSMLQEINEDRRKQKEKAERLLKPKDGAYNEFGITGVTANRSPGYERVEDYLNSEATFRFREGEASAIYQGGTLMVALRCKPGEAMAMLGYLAKWKK